MYPYATEREQPECDVRDVARLLSEIDERDLQDIFAYLSERD